MKTIIKKIKKKHHKSSIIIILLLGNIWLLNSQACDVQTRKNCSAKQKKYIGKHQAQIEEGLSVAEEMDRLNQVLLANRKTLSLNRKDRKWLEDRVGILEDLTGAFSVGGAGGARSEL
jgi:hypothetical protein